MLNAAGPEAFVVRCRIEAASDCHEASALLERYLLPLSSRLTDSVHEPELRVRIERAAGCFQLFVDNTLRASDSQAIRLVPELIRCLDDAMIGHLNGLWAVHAGAVQWGERVLLLPGASHDGKSTLVAELLRRGATYFSDEYALLDRNGCVHPYPRPLLLRNGRPEQLPSLPEEFSASTGTLPAPVGWIFSLTYRVGDIWSVAAIPQSEALVNLLRNTPHVLAETPDLVAAFQRAVEGAQCYAGRRPDAGSAVDAILGLIGDPPPCRS